MQLLLTLEHWEDPLSQEIVILPWHRLMLPKTVGLVADRLFSDFPPLYRCFIAPNELGGNGEAWPVVLRGCRR